MSICASTISRNFWPKPANEQWELIGGRVGRMMVGARWQHKRICQNIATAMLNDFRRRNVYRDVLAA